MCFEASEYEVREKPALSTWMEGGLDYIMLQYLNIDGIRTIGSVLGQSIALDYYVRQVCSISEEKFSHCEVNSWYFMLITISLLLGWRNGCRIYWYKSWDGNNWKIQNAEEKTFSVGGKGKF